jgi:hypothetical protein
MKEPCYKTPCRNQRSDHVVMITRDIFNIVYNTTGVWTNRDLIRARVRGRARARPNPS